MHWISNNVIAKQMYLMSLSANLNKKTYRKVLVNVKNINWEFTEYINYTISRRRIG